MGIRSFFHPPLVGIAIRSTHICMVQVQKRRRAVAVVRQQTQPISGVVDSGTGVVAWDVLSEYLVDSVSAWGIKGYTVAASLPTDKVQTGSMMLPAGLAVADVETEINLMVRREYPGYREHLRVDFMQTAAEDKSVNVFFAVVPETYVLAYTACFEKAGLKLRVLDVDDRAIARAQARMPDLSSQDEICLIALGLALREAPLW